MDPCLDPARCLAAPIAVDGGDADDGQVDGRVDESNEIDCPPAEEEHELHVDEFAEQLDGRGAETEVKGGLLKDVDDVAGEDDARHLLEKPDHDRNPGPAQIGALENVDPLGRTL